MSKNPSYIFRLCNWAHCMWGWRSLSRPFFMDVVRIVGLSRQKWTLVARLCNLTTFVALSNELGSLFAKRFNYKMCSTSLPHYWVREFRNMFEVDEASKFNSSHKIGYPTKHRNNFLIKETINKYLAPFSQPVLGSRMSLRLWSRWSIPRLH